MTIIRRIVLSAVFATLASVSVLAQVDDVPALKTQAYALINDNKFTEALPLYEKLARLAPADPEVQRYLGFSLLGQAKNTADPATAKALRARARAAFVKAREAGDDSPLVSGMIDSMAVDGGEDAAFSAHRQAESIMQKAEAAFAAGKMDEALDLYQQALKIDPKLYYAALFSGDVYMQKENYAEAEKWYQRAITIDPNIETAYRYSATPLMKQQKYEQARDRYVEAWITEPYSKFAIQGIVQWGQITQTGLGHPKIDVPKSTVGADGKEHVSISVSPVEDGSTAWLAYSATRENWKKEKFAKTFPAEKTYRHTVAEEADALRSVVSMATSLKAKTLNPQIATLEKLDKDGLLEAYILMALPDQGIAGDHAAYLRSSRDKLRRYVLEYVIQKK